MYVLGIITLTAVAGLLAHTAKHFESFFQGAAVGVIFSGLVLMFLFR